MGQASLTARIAALAARTLRSLRSRGGKGRTERRRSERRQPTAESLAAVKEFTARGEVAGEALGREAMRVRHREQLSGLVILLEGLLGDIGELDDVSQRERVGLILRHVRHLVSEGARGAVTVAGQLDEAAVFADVIREAARGITRAGTVGFVEVHLADTGVGWVRCDRTALRSAMEALLGICVRARSSVGDIIHIRVASGDVLVPFRNEASEGVLASITIPSRVDLVREHADPTGGTLNTKEASPWRTVAGVIFAHSGDMSLEASGPDQSIVRVFLPAADPPAWANQNTVERGGARVLVREASVRWALEGALSREGFAVEKHPPLRTPPPQGSVFVADADHPLWRELPDDTHSVVVIAEGESPPRLPAGALRVHRPFSSDDAARIARTLALRYDAA